MAINLFFQPSEGHSVHIFDNQSFLRKTVMRKHFVAAGFTLLGVAAVAQQAPP